MNLIITKRIPPTSTPKIRGKNIVSFGKLFIVRRKNTIPHPTARIKIGQIYTVTIKNKNATIAVAEDPIATPNKKLRNITSIKGKTDRVNP
ncbi:hypothetical protein [Shimazuella kribbensis]|uniref:hypothetical protein n=1 Tax=Shimazuella kribbensis TaxID=139808 RepID=UPI0012EB1EB7|nr:hypothetical protein [Shimazuella kribbensis]